MPEMEVDRVPENGSDCEVNSQNASDENNISNSGAGKKKTRKRGIVYLSTIPPYMNVAKIREIFSEFGEVGRIYLQSSASKFPRLYCCLLFLQTTLILFKMCSLYNVCGSSQYFIYGSS